MNRTTTSVVFRVFDGEVIALFPELDNLAGAANPGLCMSYMHVGQHGEADYKGVMHRSRRAREEEYRPLLNELKSIGYILNVRNTAPDHRPANKPAN